MVQKAKKMKTDTARVYLQDPGHPDDCSVFDYHKIFNANRQVDIRDWCVHAKKGCGDCKIVLSESLNQELSGIRERYEELMKDQDHLQNILDEGAQKARVKAQKTLRKVQKVLGMKTNRRN